MKRSHELGDEIVRNTVTAHVGWIRMTKCVCIIGVPIGKYEIRYAVAEVCFALRAVAVLDSLCAQMNIVCDAECGDCRVLRRFFFPVN